MQWTMPHRVLQIVAALIGLAAIAAFALGIINAPQRSGRLPGEKVAGAGSQAAPIDAADATPLSDERIEGPPQPTPEELAAAKAKAEADAKKKAEAEAANAESDQDAGAGPLGNATTLPPLRPTQPTPPQTTQPPPEEPVF